MTPYKKGEKMKAVISALSLLLVGVGKASPNFDSITAGTRNTCALSQGQLTCWGEKSDGKIPIPKDLGSVISVSIGNNNICAVSVIHNQKSLKCWGSSENGRLQIPSLVNPSLASVGSDHICALDDQGVKCWGSNTDKQLEVPKLEGTKLLSTIGSTNCALDKFGIHCWGALSGVPVDKLSKSIQPTWIGLGGYGGDLGCYKDSTGFHCWGKYAPVFTTEQQRSLKEVVAGGTHFCWLYQDSTLECDARDSFSYVVPLSRTPLVKNAFSLTAGRHHACVLEGGKSKCWGNGSEGQIDNPELLNDQPWGTVLDTYKTITGHVFKKIFVARYGPTWVDPTGSAWSKEFGPLIHGGEFLTNDLISESEASNTCDELNAHLPSIQEYKYFARYFEKDVEGNLTPEGFKDLKFLFPDVRESLGFYQASWTSNTRNHYQGYTASLGLDTIGWQYLGRAIGVRCIKEWDKDCVNYSDSTGTNLRCY